MLLLLKMMDAAEYVELQSYIDKQRAVYFQHYPPADGASGPVLRARWARDFYYVHAREFLEQKSLRSGQLAHGFLDGQFTALVPPASISDPTKQEEAQQIISSLCPEDIEMVDQVL